MGDFGIFGFGLEGFEIWCLWLSVTVRPSYHNLIEFNFFLTFPEPSNFHWRYILWSPPGPLAVNYDPY